MSEAEPISDSLDQIEAALDYRFENRRLLEMALRHSSFAHDMEDVESNERLEFLGDSVIGLVVAHSLYLAKPEWDEGELTRALHALVEGRSLAILAQSLGIGDVLSLGRTERQSGGHSKKSILADAMEAVIGAIYLDGGLEAVRVFVERVFEKQLAEDSPAVARDPKTELQERAMASRKEFPTYRMLRDSLLEGDDERFMVEALLCGESLAEGIGRTKRAAERAAAAKALENWVDEPGQEGSDDVA